MKYYAEVTYTVHDVEFEAPEGISEDELEGRAMEAASEYLRRSENVLEDVNDIMSEKDFD